MILISPLASRSILQSGFSWQKRTNSSFVIPESGMRSVREGTLLIASTIAYSLAGFYFPLTARRA